MFWIVSVLSASLDGTVRAFDLGRYRNFRTFAAPEPCQFSCIAVDASGDLVAAGGLDTFSVHVWAVRTGQLLDLLTGHEGPVSGLEFAPNSAVLASASWDRSVRLWDVLDSRNSREDFRFQSDGELSRTLLAKLSHVSVSASFSVQPSASRFAPTETN